MTKASVKPSPPSLCQQRPWKVGVSRWHSSPPLLSSCIPLSLAVVIGLDFHSFSWCSIRTQFPFWEGEQGFSALWDDYLKTPLALPIPSSASAAPLTKAARFASFPITQEKEPPGILESSGWMQKDSFKVIKSNLPVSPTEKRTRQQGAELRATPGSSAVQATCFPPLPAACHGEFRCSTNNTVIHFPLSLAQGTLYDKCQAPLRRVSSPLLPMEWQPAAGRGDALLITGPNLVQHRAPLHIC